MYIKTTSLFLAFSITSVLTVFSHESETQLPFERPHAHEALEGHAHIGWESRYFSEGRDSLSGDSLFTNSVEVGWNHLAGGIWYGGSPDQNYDELQLTLALIQSIGNVEFYGAYTHLRFPFDNSHDNELGAGFTWLELPLGLELTADIYYSFDADGYFAEIAASRSFVITDQLSFSLTNLFGINQGYVTDGHNGANHLALSIGLEYAFTNSISMIAHTTQSWALDKDSVFSGDEQLIDFFHMGVGLQWAF